MNRKAYIKELEREHNKIIHLFDQLESDLDKEEVIDHKRFCEILLELKELMLQHLRSEDDAFYPDMKNRAIELHQEALLPALGKYIDDMKLISTKAFKLFEDCNIDSCECELDTEFIRNVKEVRDELLARIRSEEKSLFHIYKGYFLDKLV
ncbi:MAG: hemerythrin domain-containing protein [Deltaproteobacteria bacterium]|nr:hemerythrin domain-containing protein [Deltaproteobacteria bacterium]